MITFYRTPDCSVCQDIQETLRRLCLAHDVVLVEDFKAPSIALPAGTPPPVLMDNGQAYQGHTAILAQLVELEAIKEIWYKYQSDACYCDAEGNIE